jgi:hypothetical protein
MIVMTSSVGIVGSTAGGVVPPVVAAPAAAGSVPSFTLPTSTAAALPLAQNPHVVLDPSAGFITQYLSANGSQVVSQTPSAITVAYLRLGLTADGLSKTTPSVAATA